MEVLKTQMPPWVSEKSIQFFTGLKKERIRRIKENGEWIKGLHYNYVNPKSPNQGVIYNSALCLDWVNNLETPEVHEQAIQLWVEQNNNHTLVKQATSLHIIDFGIAQNQQ